MQGLWKWWTLLLWHIVQLCVHNAVVMESAIVLAGVIDHFVVGSVEAGGLWLHPLVASQPLFKVCE